MGLLRTPLKFPADCNFADQRDTPALRSVHHRIEPAEGVPRLQEYLRVDGRQVKSISLQSRIYL
jgi:hypothetical protein